MIDTGIGNRGRQFPDNNFPRVYRDSLETRAGPVEKLVVSAIRRVRKLEIRREETARVAASLRTFKLPPKRYSQRTRYLTQQLRVARYNAKMLSEALADCGDSWLMQQEVAHSLRLKYAPLRVPHAGHRNDTTRMGDHRKARKTLLASLPEEPDVDVSGIDPAKILADEFVFVVNEIRRLRQETRELNSSMARNALRREMSRLSGDLKTLGFTMPDEFRFLEEMRKPGRPRKRRN